VRVVHVVNVRWLNATAWYGLTLAQAMVKAGHTVAVLALPGTETFARGLELGLDVRGLDLNARAPWAVAGLYARLRAFSMEFRPDVVNCHRGEAFVLWGLLKALGAGFALVRTRGDQRPPKSNLVNRWLHCRAADAVVATNAGTEAVFRDRLRVPADKLFCIRGGVDRERFRFDPSGRERVRAEFGYSEQDQVVGLLGRFDRVKGQRELIQAVAELREAGRERLKLLLVGFPTATSEAEVQGWIDEFRVADITRITGRRPDVAACLSACDLGVAPSLWSEAIARAALEFMACERPLLATTVGVMPDLLSPDALVPPADAGALALGVARLLDAPDLRARLAREQNERLRELDLASFLRQTLAVYERALGRP
jgi:glycosyltransferase involved in cell wall biosynthesis